LFFGSNHKYLKTTFQSYLSTFSKGISISLSRKPKNKNTCCKVIKFTVGPYYAKNRNSIKRFNMMLVKRATEYLSSRPEPRQFIKFKVFSFFKATRSNSFVCPRSKKISSGLPKFYYIFKKSSFGS